MCVASSCILGCGYKSLDDYSMQCHFETCFAGHMPVRVKARRCPTASSRLDGDCMMHLCSLCSLSTLTRLGVSSLYLYSVCELEMEGRVREAISHRPSSVYVYRWPLSELKRCVDVWGEKIESYRDLHCSGTPVRVRVRSIVSQSHVDIGICQIVLEDIQIVDVQAAVALRFCFPRKIWDHTCIIHDNSGRRCGPLDPLWWYHVPGSNVFEFSILPSRAVRSVGWGKRHSRIKECE